MARGLGIPIRDSWLQTKPGPETSGSLAAGPIWRPADAATGWRLWDGTDGGRCHFKEVDADERTVRFMDGEFDEACADTLAEVVARLGMSDVRAFGLAWEDCEALLG